MIIRKLIISGDNMKRSRLNLFKATSMSISVLGILLILATIALFAYIGISTLSSTVSSDVSSGSAYDQIAVLKSDYSTLSTQFDDIKTTVDTSNNAKLQSAYDNATLELVRAQSAISDADSAVSAGESQDEIKSRISTAQTQLQNAESSFSDVKAMM